MKRQKTKRRLIALLTCISLAATPFANQTLYAAETNPANTRTFDIQTNDYRSSSRNRGDQFCESKWEGVTPYGPLFGQIVNEGNDTRPLGLENGDLGWGWGSSDWMTGYIMVDTNAFGEMATQGLPKDSYGLSTIGIVRVNQKNSRTDDFASWQDSLEEAFQTYNGNAGFGAKGFGNADVYQETPLVIWDGYRRNKATEKNGKEYIGSVEDVASSTTRARQEFAEYIKGAIQNGAKLQGYITTASGVSHLYEPTNAKYRNGTDQIKKVPQIKITGVTYDILIQHNNKPEGVELPDTVTIKAGDTYTFPTVAGYRAIWTDEDEDRIGEQLTVNANRHLNVMWTKDNIVPDIDYTDLEDTTTDSDQDGLVDELELRIGTDKNKKDTDGDGLTDYQEVVDLKTDPLKTDTDGNGINDFDEDFDGDTLSNGYEYRIGTNPTNKDTDNDFINDNDELNIYNTSPIKSDTDGDGALDRWEIENKYDPTVANEAFRVTESMGEVSEANPVAAGVALDLNGNQIYSLTVKPVSVADNPYISKSVPGYMGNAYEFQVDGEIKNATLTFEYDKTNKKIGEDFQPRIYYFNDKTHLFEELENQTVIEGKVTATTTHFSTYILLNKVEFEEVWNTEIKPPIVEDDGTEASLDIAFVIDYSGSMEDNDSKQLFKKLSKEFIDKLRNGTDKAAVIKFIKKATLVSELTTDKEQLKSAVDSIVYDDGYGVDSGTDGSTGYKMALDELSKSNSKYKYIVFITDGEDNNFTHSYDGLIISSIHDNVVVYTIGMGNASESVLKKVAYQTDGAYYHATTGTASGNIIDLDKVFQDIQVETIDKTIDTNDDGIPDYYTNLIKEGKLVLSNGSNEFRGIDFNYDADGKLSNDYDGDGLKNGEEIQLVYRNNRVYLIMKSNPMLVHSDRDGIDDYRETLNETDPMAYQMYGSTVEQLLNKNLYYYDSLVKEYDYNLDYFLSAEILRIMLVVGNKDEIYRDIMVDYFSNYADSNYLHRVETDQTRKTMIETLSSMLANIQAYGTAPLDFTKEIMDLIDAINATSEAAKIRELLLTKCWEICQDLYKIDYRLCGVGISTYPMKSQTLTLMSANGVMDKVGDICKGVTYISYGMDVVDTIDAFSKVSANLQAFESNIDLLNEIKYNSTDEHARNAANDIINRLSGNFVRELRAVAVDGLELGLKWAISTVAKKNIYGLAFIAVRDGINIITGLSTNIKQLYQMICYDRMIKANRTLIHKVMEHRGRGYYVNGENIDDANRHFINYAQLSILGEKKYLEVTGPRGIKAWFTDDSDSERRIKEQIEWIKELMDKMGLKVSPKI